MELVYFNATVGATFAMFSSESPFRREVIKKTSFPWRGKLGNRSEPQSCLLASIEDGRERLNRVRAVNLLWRLALVAVMEQDYRAGAHLPDSSLDDFRGPVFPVVSRRRPHHHAQPVGFEGRHQAKPAEPVRRAKPTGPHARDLFNGFLGADDFAGYELLGMQQKQRVRIGMVANGVALLRDTPNDVGMALNILTAQEECRRNLAFRKDVENLVGKGGGGAVVESEEKLAAFRPPSNQNRPEDF